MYNLLSSSNSHYKCKYTGNREFYLPSEMCYVDNIKVVGEELDLVIEFYVINSHIPMYKSLSFKCEVFSDQEIKVEAPANFVVVKANDKYHPENLIINGTSMDTFAYEATTSNYFKTHKELMKKLLRTGSDSYKPTNISLDTIDQFHLQALVFIPYTNEKTKDAKTQLLEFLNYMCQAKETKRVIVLPKGLISHELQFRNFPTITYDKNLLPNVDISLLSRMTMLTNLNHKYKDNDYRKMFHLLVPVEKVTPPSIESHGTKIVGLDLVDESEFKTAEKIITGLRSDNKNLNIVIYILDNGFDTIDNFSKVDSFKNYKHVKIEYEKNSLVSFMRMLYCNLILTKENFSLYTSMSGTDLEILKVN